MFLRTLFASVFIIVLSFVGLSAENLKVGTNSLNTYTQVTEELCEGCTEVRVLIEGVWWIIVYGPDGSIIDIYPDLDE